MKRESTMRIGNKSQEANIILCIADTNRASDGWYRKHHSGLNYKGIGHEIHDQPAKEGNRRKGVK
jgi:hypothetical protein